MMGSVGQSEAAVEAEDRKDMVQEAQTPEESTHTGKGDERLSIEMGGYWPLNVCSACHATLALSRSWRRQGTDSRANEGLRLSRLWHRRPPVI